MTTWVCPICDEGAHRDTAHMHLKKHVLQATLVNGANNLFCDHGQKGGLFKIVVVKPPASELQAATSSGAAPSAPRLPVVSPQTKPASRTSKKKPGGKQALLDRIAGIASAPTFPCPHCGKKLKSAHGVEVHIEARTPKCMKKRERSEAPA